MHSLQTPQLGADLDSPCAWRTSVCIWPKTDGAAGPIEPCAGGQGHGPADPAGPASHVDPFGTSRGHSPRAFPGGAWLGRGSWEEVKGSLTGICNGLVLGLRGPGWSCTLGPTVGFAVWGGSWAPDCSPAPTRFV